MIMASKRSKRNWQFENISRYKPSETEPEEQTTCQMRDDNEGELQDFFDLVNRIQEMNKILRKSRMTSGSLEDKSKDEQLDLKILKSGSPWMPSFEWEDFSYGSVSSLEGKDGGSKQRDLNSANINKKVDFSVQSREEDRLSANHTMGSSSDKHTTVACFDLNVETTPEQPLVQRLGLFP